MKDKDYDYSCTLIKSDEEFSEFFLDAGKSLIDTKDLFGDGFEDEPHVTVLYGLHALDPSIQLIEIVETYPKFAITLGNISLFKEEKYDVVKVDVDCSDLYALRSAFMNSGDYFSLTHPEYIPHMTVAFVKPNSCDHLDGNSMFKGKTFVATFVTYSCKDGLNRVIELGYK